MESEKQIKFLGLTPEGDFKLEIDGEVQIWTKGALGVGNEMSRRKRAFIAEASIHIFAANQSNCSAEYSVARAKELADCLEKELGVFY